jgi:phosphonate transport system substrate-binding protein
MKPPARVGGGRGWLRATVVTVALAAWTVLGPPFAPVRAAQDTRPLTLAVHPYLPALEIERRFRPLADHLARRIGRKIGISVSSDYAVHIRRVGTHAVDLAYLGPAPYVDLIKTHGHEFFLLARQETTGRPAFHGHIVVADTSDIRTLADLRGRSFAFGDPRSTMGHLVPLYMLLETGVKLDDLTSHRFLGGHRNVALAVLSDDLAAGALKEDIFEDYRARGLRSIAVSPALSDHLFVATCALPAGLAEDIRAVLLTIGRDPADRAVLTAVQPDLTGLIPVADSDYDGLRRILDRLAREGVP